MEPKKGDIVLGRCSNFTLLGNNIFINIYGFCHPYRIEFLKERKLVYMWDKNDEIREEFFFGETKPTRVYKGDKFCFIEYCEMADNKKDFPDDLDLVNTDLEKALIKTYEDSLKKIIETN